MLHPKIKFGCSTLGAPARLAEHPRPPKGLNGYLLRRIHNGEHNFC